MRRLYRFPYVFLLVFAVILLGLVIHGASVFLHKVISENKTAFLIYSAILSIISLFCGVAWTGSTKSYTVEEFTDTFCNTRICDHVIYLSEQRKKELKDMKKDS